MRAQAQPQNRTSFVFHAYVDPLYGDDELAGNQVTQIISGGNPVTVPPFNPKAGTKEPLSDHPHDPTWTKLQHAPYTFRTLTAALSWAGTFGLPYAVPNTNLTMERVVVHCLPGVYGPTGGGTIDPKSGLPFNGETFPIVMRERVCIQGACALNTIFDGRGFQGILFNVGGSLSTPTEHYEKTFIDSITIRGARGPGYPGGAGIAVWGGSDTRVVISNCIITDNQVGIAIDGYPDPGKLLHSPAIVNNTIAWNQIGIWNGPFIPRPMVGHSRPRILNNIIDSRDMLGVWAAAGGTSGFEGIDPSDLTVATIGSTTVNIDFNAYDPNNVNRGTAFAAGWPATAPRTASPSYSPRVTMSGGLVDYRIFVSEIFYAAQGPLQPGGGFADGRSPHDFRLAPLAQIDLQGALNPMVNKGVDTSAGVLRFANFLSATRTPDIGSPPGLSGPGDQPLDTQYATIHCWDWDCEGFGNARIFNRPGFPAPPQHSTYIDLGADEAGNLVMAGFIDRTRIFSRVVPDGGTGYLGIPDHTQVYFFDLPEPFGAGTYPRPYYSGYIGGRQGDGLDYLWWRWVQQTSSAMFRFVYQTSVNGPFTTSNYTIGETASWRWFQKTNLYPLPFEGAHWEPFLRNLECDLSPHLISDIHAAWAAHFTVSVKDEFGANPWHHHNHADATTLPRRADNHFLYYKPAHPLIPTAVFDGTINPPATWLWGGIGPTGGYIGSFPTAQFGPYGYAGASTYTVNAWGFGDVSPGPDIVPESNNWLGERYNCELQIGGSFGFSNLQTFLAVNGVPPAETEGGLAGARFLPPKTTTRPPEPTLEHYAKALERLDFTGK